MANKIITNPLKTTQTIQNTKTEELLKTDSVSTAEIINSETTADIQPTITQQPKQESKAMTESKDIIIKLEKPAHIKFTMQNTGDESPRIVHEQKIVLARGTIYKLPITDDQLDLQKAYVIRPSAKFAELIKILNVSNGFVTVEPIIHGVIINHQDNVGSVI